MCMLEGEGFGKEGQLVENPSAHQQTTGLRRCGGYIYMGIYITQS